jgi:hypothetical protein
VQPLADALSGGHGGGGEGGGHGVWGRMRVSTGCWDEAADVVGLDERGFVSLCSRAAWREVLEPSQSLNSALIAR